MPVDRLTAEDLLMLWPDEIWPQEIGALAVLDGSSLLAPGGCFRIEAVREVIAARLHLVRRFRQLLYVPRRGLGGPLWVDAPSFDLGDHVRIVPLPDPGRGAVLLLPTERRRRRRLDRSRPLWEMCFLPGLPENRVGMFVKMHHAIADGIAGVATLGALLDAAPGVPTGSAQPWTPAPPPAARDLRTGASPSSAATSAWSRRSPISTARRSTTSCWRSPPAACAGCSAIVANPSTTSSCRSTYPSRCARHRHELRRGET